MPDTCVFLLLYTLRELGGGWGWGGGVAASIALCIS